MAQAVLDFGRTLNAATLRYASANPSYSEIQLEFHVSCRLRSELGGPRDRIFAFRFLNCRGLMLACRQWDAAGHLMKRTDLALIEALHMDVLRPLALDYFHMKGWPHLEQMRPHMAGGRWLRGAFEGFESALSRGAPCFWMRAGGAGLTGDPIDGHIMLVCDAYKVLAFDREIPPEEFAAIGDRWRQAWEDYWERRRRGEVERNAEFEWMQPYSE